MDELHPLSGFNVDHAGMEILAMDECHRLLHDTLVARLAFVDRGEPVVFPIRYAMWGESVVFTAAPGSKLEAAIMSRPVAVEIDDWQTEEHTGWSVLVKGTAMTVSDPDEIEELDQLGVTPWVHPDTEARWVRVLPNEITGRRLPAT